MANKGLIHLYYGYGKGKTTAAFGLALRASGCDKKVVIVQFLKNWKSGEIMQLDKLDNITVIRGLVSNKFSFDMTDEEKAANRELHNDHLKEALSYVEKGECDVLILDEVVDAYAMDLLDAELYKDTLLNKKEELEIVMTGHSCPDWIKDCCNYVTEMVKIKHPYDEGIIARKGIEF